jgi:hypothetical protein
MENKAWFWLMGSNWPLQNVHPLGGKFQLMILISPRNGSDMCISLCRPLKAGSYHEIA